MSLSPIERQGESDAGDRGGRSRGLGRWLARLVSRVADRARGWLASAAAVEADVPADTQRTRTPETADEQRQRPDRPSHESGQTGRQLPATPPAELPARPDHEDAVEATLDGDSLRIHRPGEREAYIVSDVYERVEP